ncbi:GFA family protein [Mesorhizobium sp. CAU 1741]|uniref:GFA family protein n=1 Tax=Mesorhizobium sp. CAU 1741 TaxID=3140366 RepID=UPI00325B744A
MKERHTGGCLCGGVRFSAHGALRGVLYCHCSQCRRQTGHFYAATNLAKDDLQIEGADNVTWFAASPEALRGFCATCGSALFWKGNGAEHVSIMAGAFDQPSALRGEAHIFVADKGGYYEITDGLPQFSASNG